MHGLEQMTPLAWPAAIALLAAVVAVWVRRLPSVRIRLFVNEGRYVEAGEVALGAGLALKALDCFLKGGQYERAALCAVRAGSAGLAANLFERAGDAKTAAVLYEQAGMGARAAALQCDPNLRALRAIARTTNFSASDEAVASKRVVAFASSELGIKRDPGPVCRDVIRRVKQLDASPAATGRVLRLLDDPEADPASVARELERDQQLATMVLRAANSALYGASGGVRDVTAALVLLGFDSMRQLVVGRLSAQMLGKRNDRVQAALWKHALATAVGAQVIARARQGISPGHAFTAGLLHDLGKAVLYQAFPAEYAGVWADSETDARPMYELEAARFGTDHAEVGAELLRLWKLPAIYATVVLAHHGPAAEYSLPPEAAQLRAAVVLASAIATWLGHGRFPARPIEGFDAASCGNDLGCSPELVSEVAAAVERDLAAYEGIFR